MSEPTIRLSDGKQMLRLAYGLGGVPVETATALVGTAIAAGYKLISTAAKYGNDKEVGDAIASSKISGGQHFITSKCWPGQIERNASDIAVGGFELCAENVGDLLAPEMGIDGKSRPDTEIAA